MLTVAVLILGLGFYEQYTKASGIFAPDGLAQQVAALVDSLNESTAASADSSLDAFVNEAAPGISAAADPSAPVQTPDSLTFGHGSSLEHCSSKRFLAGRCH
jgi:hypothetical protein